MATITQDLGAVTAYGYAKDAGYTGTEAEFTQLLGDLADTVADLEGLTVSISTLPAGSSATASYSDGVLSLGIPKGDKGDTGNTGATGPAAGFGEVSATVDSSVGTPSVDVSASGPDTAKQFAFAFHNLKGDKGDTGEVSEAELAAAIDKVAIKDTASGPIASFPDGADGMPLKSLVINIEPVQAGSGDPSPDNVRPISGHTGADVTLAGKNLFAISGVTYGKWCDNSGNISDATYGCISGWIFADSETAYRTDCFGDTPYSSSIIEYDSNFNFIRRNHLVGERSNSITSSPSTRWIRLQFANGGSGTYTITEQILNSYKAVFTKGSTAPTAYIDYGTTKSISFGTTIYGGTDEVVSGSGVSNRALIDLGTVEWEYNTTTLNVPVFKTKYSLPDGIYNKETDFVCTAYKFVGARANLESNDMAFARWNSLGAASVIAVRDTRYTDAETFKTAMSGVQVCYELATPTDFSTTPVTDLVTQYGDNNVWNDCGDTTVEYVADPKLYINKIVAALA